MLIIEFTGLFLVGIVGIILFILQSNIWNPWNGTKERELFEEYGDWSKVDKEIEPNKRQKRRVLIGIVPVWLIGFILEIMGNIC